MKLTIKIPPDRLPYRGEPTREVHITDEELRMIEAGEKIVKPTGRVALKGNLTWTAEEDEFVASAYKSGKSVPEICAETGRTKDSVVHRIQKLSKAGGFEMRPHGRMRKQK